MTTEERATYEKAVETWGDGPQIDMIVEECSELIQGCGKLIQLIQKGKRKSFDTETIDNIQEEIADVFIMLEQAKIIFGETEVNTHKEAKLKRLQGKLEKTTE